MEAGLTGAFSAGLFYGIGTFSVNRFADGSLAKTLLHGAGGGIMSRLRGGSFKSGFLSTAVTQSLSPNFSKGALGRATTGVRVAMAAVVGGTMSVIGGGKFANGAVTGAFSRLFNGELHPSDGGRIEMRRVGDRLFPVRVFECATAECVAMGANLDLNDPGTQAFLRATDAKALSDLGTAASLVILKTPVSALGNAAARTSLAADVSKTILTGNPAAAIPAVTGRFAQGVANSTLGVTSEATINRIGAGTGLLMNQVIDQNER